MTSIESIADAGQYDILEHYATKLGFDEEQISTFEAVLDTIEEILEKKVRPNIFEWEEEGVTVKDGKAFLPGNMQEVLDEVVKDNELYSWFIPEEYGGYGYTNVFQCALTELTSKYDISFQISSFISLSVIEALTVYHKEAFDEHLDKFAKGDYTGYVAFTEPQAGSNLENVKATAELDGDEYVLNGTKIFISNGGHANAGLFLGKNIVDGEEDGTNVLFVPDVEGVICERAEEKSGLHANPTSQLHFEEVRVPKEYIISKPGDGYRKVLERLMGMRIGVAMQGVGAAIRAYELSKQYAEEREQFGKPIGEFDGVKRKLKAMERTIPRLRAYGFDGGYSLDRYYRGWIPSDIGASGGASEKTAADMFPNTLRTGLAHYHVSAAKLYCSEVSNTLLYDAQQIFGGNGFITEYEVNKIGRDIRVLPIYEGTSEIHEWIINRAQDALNQLPKFKKMSSKFENGPTTYEKILFERFPNLQDQI